MIRQAALTSALILALCVVTVLSVTLLWRFDVVERDLLRGGTFADGFAGWEDSRSGVLRSEEASEAMLCLGPASSSEAIPYVTVPVSLSPAVGYLRVTAEVTADGLIKGRHGWQSGQLRVWSFDSEGAALAYWPSALAVLDGSQPWQREDLIVPVGPPVAAAQLVAFNGALAGGWCLRGLQVDGLREKPIFTALRLGLWPAWATALLWLAFLVARPPGSRGLKAAFYGITLLMLTMILLPQPYYGAITGPLEALLGHVAPGVGVDHPPPGGESSSLASPQIGSAAQDRVEDGGGVPSQPGVTAPSHMRSLSGPLSLQLDITFGDLAHAAAFCLWAFVACLLFGDRPLPLILLCLVLAILASESLQLLLITRGSEGRDLVVDGLGAAFGMGFAALLRIGRGLSIGGGKPAAPAS